MWGRMRRWLFLKALAEVKRNKTAKPPLHQNPMHDIHILYEIATQDDFDTVTSWVRQLKKSGKRVDTLAFLKTPNLSLTEAENTYITKEVGTNYVPKNEKIQRFLSSHADILVVLCHHFHQHLRYITYAHDSYFKIGLYFPNGESYLDMMVETDPNASYESVIQQIVKSINKLSYPSKP